MQSRTRKYAAVVAVAVLLLIPLSYGAVKAIKHFIVYEDEFVYPQEDGSVTVLRTTTSIGGDNINSREDAEKVLREFKQLYEQGKAEQIRPGVWHVTLSDGDGFNFGGDPNKLLLSDADKQESVKKQFDEIHALQKAGKFEKTYKPEHDFEVDGVKYRYFEAAYTLSDGRVVTMGQSEPAEQK